MAYQTYNYYQGMPNTRYNYGYRQPVSSPAPAYMYPDPNYVGAMPGQMNVPVQQAQPQARRQPQQAASPFPSRLWVTGIEGAKGFQISPNTKVMLMDSERNKFYIKSANADGVPSIESYSYQKDGEGAGAPTNSVPMALEDIITKKDFEALEGHLAAKYDEIISAINAVKPVRDNQNDKKK